MSLRKDISNHTWAKEFGDPGEGFLCKCDSVFLPYRTSGSARFVPKLTNPHLIPKFWDPECVISKLL